jgi:hypothetical protein
MPPLFEELRRALCVAHVRPSVRTFVRPYVRPYDFFSTHLLRNYSHEIHQTFPDYSPWCVVVHEGGDWHYRVSTKRDMTLCKFFLYAVYREKSCQRNSF